MNIYIFSNIFNICIILKWLIKIEEHPQLKFTFSKSTIETLEKGFRNYK